MPSTGREGVRIEEERSRALGSRPGFASDELRKLGLSFPSYPMELGGAGTSDQLIPCSVPQAHPSLQLLRLVLFSQRAAEVHFTYQTVHFSKAHSGFSTFTKLCSHRHRLLREHSVTLKRNVVPVSSHSTSPSPVPGDQASTVCLQGFAHLGHFIEVESHT